MTPVVETTLAVASIPDASPLNRIEAFLTAARSASMDGLTWQEFGELLVSFLKLATSVYDTVSNMTGPEKKAAVLDAVARLFDGVADRAVPLVAWPIWIVARPAIRSLVLALASGAIEQLLPLVRLA